MVNRFFISDTHFGHSAVYTFTDKKTGQRIRPWADNPDDGDEYMIKMWNSIVKPLDKVYHLGDVAFPRKSLALLDRLNGKKVLIKGNHDIFDLSDYTKYFVDVRGAFEHADMIFTHVPVHTHLKTRWKLNVHGHLHSDRIDDAFYVNVSVEQLNATPIHFDELVSKV